MSVRIIQKGIFAVPSWAGTCPVCGNLAITYKKEKLADVLEPNTAPLMQCSTGRGGRPQVKLAATFTCYICDTKWQWYEKD